MTAPEIIEAFYRGESIDGIVEDADIHREEIETLIRGYCIGLRAATASDEIEVVVEDVGDGD